MKSHPHSSLGRVLVCAAALALGTAPALAAGDKKTYETTKSLAKETYTGAVKACDPLDGNAKDVCIADAKAARVRSEAEAEAAYKGTPKAREDAARDIAEANYKAAKERCDDLKGNAEEVCEKEAKAALTRARADAKANRKSVSARDDATKDKMKADYEVAKQKCDALSGDAKDACMKQAKARYPH